MFSAKDATRRPGNLVPMPAAGRSRLTTEQLIYVGRASGWLLVSGLEPR